MPKESWPYSFLLLLTGDNFKHKKTHTNINHPQKNENIWQKYLKLPFFYLFVISPHLKNILKIERNFNIQNHFFLRNNDRQCSRKTCGMRAGVFRLDWGVCSRPALKQLSQYPVSTVRCTFIHFIYRTWNLTSEWWGICSKLAGATQSRLVIIVIFRLF